MPALENDGAPPTAQAYYSLDIPILDRINNEDLTYNWMFAVRQQSPPPPPPSSPETRERSCSRCARAHSAHGRKPQVTRHYQIESHRSPVSDDPHGDMHGHTGLPPSYIDSSSITRASQQSSFSEDDAATTVDVSSPTQSFFSDSDTILGEPNKHSPHLNQTWDGVDQYKQQDHSQLITLSIFPKPSPYDANTRREYQPVPDASRCPRKNISYPIMGASTTAPLTHSILSESSAGRSNSWPSSTHFESSRASPVPPSPEEKSGWYAEDEKEEKKGRRRKCLSRVRRAFSCGGQGDR